MIARYRQGFTIIEVLLFLGITGLLAVTLLGGWTTMINTQRYHDSVKTTQAFIQQQYGLVYNVQNGRDDSLDCTVGGPDGPKVEDSTPMSPGPGQTDCVVMGRYIHISNGNDIKVYSIVGADGQSNGVLSDNQAIKDRNPVRLDQSLNLTDSELQVPWQASVVDKNGNDINVVIAIIRSPQSGSVHTYSEILPNATMPLVSELVKVDNENTRRDLCLDSGTALSGGRMGVVIQPYASSQSSIQTISDGEGVC